MADLGYINGVIKSKSTQLIDLKQVEQLRHLSKSELVNTLESMQVFKKQVSVDQSFYEDELLLMTLLKSLFPFDHVIFRLFFLTQDHITLTSIFKSYLLDMPLSISDDQLSLYKYSDVEEILTTDATVKTETALKNLFEDLKGKTSKEISDGVFKYLHQQLYKGVSQTMDTALKQYFVRYTDMQNVVLYFRCKVFNLALDVFESSFLSHGSIDIDYFKESYDRSIEIALESLKRFYPVHLFKCLKAIDSQAFLAILYDDLDNHLMELIDEFTYQLDGLSPTLEYVLKRRLRMKIIKQIYYEKAGFRDA